MKLLLLSGNDIRRALPMDRAVELMKTAFAELSLGHASAPQRGVMPVPEANGTTLVMGGHIPGRGLCSKVVSIFHGNEAVGKRVVSGLVVVLDPATGEPVGLCDGAFLTAWRTGAASGAATDLLARDDARVGAVIGCGAQAATQLLGLDAVREFDVIRVYGRSRDRATAFARDHQGSVRARLEVAATAREAVSGVDVVCTATNSATPVVEGQWLDLGVHVNGIGSFTPEMAELDVEAVGRSSVFVDSVESALEEAGDLICAERAGVTARSTWVELGMVVAKEQSGRLDAEQITLFKSVGNAVQDVAAAAAALSAAQAGGLGREMEL